MKCRSNLFPLAGFLVTLAAFLSYFLFFARFPVTRDFPWVNLLLFVAGFALLGLGLKRAFGQPELYRGKVSGVILTLLSAVVFGFFAFYTFYFSRLLPASQAAPRLGQQAPAFTLPDSHGRPVSLAGLLAPAAPGSPGRWALLVFYRGYW